MKQEARGNRKRLVGMLAAACWVACVIPVLGQDKPTGVGTQKPVASSKPSVADEKKPAKSVRGRLPNHYGKLSINSEQRTRIYKIQTDYRKQISELQAELEQLRVDEQVETETVLTDDQRAALKRYQTEAEARRAKRRTADTTSRD